MSHFPIWKYRYNISRAIEKDYTITTKQHIEFVRENKIQRAIGYETASQAIPPRADPEKRQIVFNESYLMFLWAFIYFAVLLFEKHIVPQHNNNRRVIIDYRNDPIVLRANKIFSWACSLKKECSAWSGNFPAESADPEEKQWGGKATTIWIRTVSFLFFHEFTHLTCDHYYAKEKDDLLAMEKEADNAAFDAVMSASVEKNSECKLGILLAVTANLFFIENPSLVHQLGSHPDLDDRIHFLLQRFNLDNEPDSEYFYYMLSCLCVFAFKNFSFPYTLQKEYKTARDYFMDVLNNFDDLKRHVLRGI
jgi:hypothetical protein